MSKRAEQAMTDLETDWVELQQKMPTLLEAIRTGTILKEDDFCDAKIMLLRVRNSILTLQDMNQAYDRRKNPPPIKFADLSATPPPAQNRFAHLNRSNQAQDLVDDWLKELVTEHHLAKSVLDKGNDSESFDFRVKERRNEVWEGEVSFEIPDQAKESLDKIFEADNEESFDDQLEERLKEAWSTGDLDVETNPEDSEFDGVEFEFV